MGLCEKCGKSFPNLTGNTCNKCIKLTGPGLTDFERGEIKKQPQCKGCSMVYILLEGSLCGACDHEEDRLCTAAIRQLEEDPVIELLRRAQQHKDDASSKRLKQPLQQNAALKKASEVRSRQTKQAIQIVNKTSRILVEGSLQYHALSSDVLRKAKVALIAIPMMGTDEAKTLLKNTKKQLRDAYDAIPAQEGCSKPQLDWGKAYITITQPNSKKPLAITNKDYAAGTVENMFSLFTNDGLITPAEVKARRFGITLVAYEIDEDDENASADVSESETSDLDGPGRKKKDDFKVPAVPAKKRKASASMSETRPPYRSSFRPPVDEVPELEYDTYRFTKVTVVIDDGGSPTVKYHDELDSIEIVAGWADAISDTPNGGYLSKGYSKIGFLGKYKGERFAIFQARPNHALNKANTDDLVDELRLLARGQYFLDSFKQRAQAYGKSVPKMRWNYAGAFVGIAETADTAPEGVTAPALGTSLTYNAFLVLPFLDIAGSLNGEVKFSGADQAGHNSDTIGRWMDVYAHHVLDDSLGHILLTDLQGALFPGLTCDELVLYDPQAHTLKQDSGYWDKGSEGINAFKLQHKCKTLCQALGLPKLKGTPAMKSTSGKEQETSGKGRTGGEGGTSKKGFHLA
ncbi:hypothetical protein DFP72DRAFT_1073895 [Ephemerocybe angulata]|uniref:Alpha-type protein kinase domain-containing protein n=1 Tax=Ephemerocybe angulata TaxID=980116 RepID=A0A8H6M231_9AGAR|nr:hypothetical protein DFP72DRAFT_1073895 [Tulosesus angulatus]